MTSDLSTRTDEASHPRSRISLRTKLGMLAAGLTLVPIPALGFVLMHEARQGLEEQAKAFQLALAGDVAGSLDNQLHDAEDGLDTVGRLLMSDLPEEHAVTASLRSVEGIQALDHVGIFDARGRLVDTVRQAGAADPQLPDELEEALRQEAAARGVALGQPLAGDVAIRLLVVVPLRPSPMDAPTAFAASRVSLEALQDHVEQLARERFADPAGTLYVLEADLRVVASADGMEAASAPRLDEHPLVRGLRQAEFRTAFAQQRVYEFGGTEYLGTLRSVPGRGWGIVVQVPTDDAFGPVYTMRAVVVATSLLVALFALGLGLWMARSLTEPIRSLVQMAERLGRRELGTTVQVKTSDELRVLGDALNRASQDLADSDAKIREEEAIRADLGRYLPAKVVGRVVDREQDMRLGGSRRDITVLFADVVNFTPLTEAHEPEVVVAILNELFTFLTEIVFRHDGTVDKFIGDCVMAIWNAPSDQPDHAERALSAAEDMLRWLESGNVRWQETYGVRIEVAIGVHTGEAIVGNVGSETRMAYTAIGDVVNIAARLEAIARPQQVLVTQATKDAAGDLFEYRDAGERALAGRKGSVQLFEVEV